MLQLVLWLSSGRFALHFSVAIGSLVVVRSFCPSFQCCNWFFGCRPVVLPSISVLQLVLWLSSGRFALHFSVAIGSLVVVRSFCPSFQCCNWFFGCRPVVLPSISVLQLVLWLSSGRFALHFSVAIGSLVVVRSFCPSFQCCNWFFGCRPVVLPSILVLQLVLWLSSGRFALHFSVAIGSLVVVRSFCPSFQCCNWFFGCRPVVLPFISVLQLVLWLSSGRFALHFSVAIGSLVVVRSFCPPF